MNTKAKIVDDLINIFYSNAGNSDIKLNKRQVGFWVDSVRATLIKEFLNKEPNVIRNIPTQLIQDLGCLELECKDLVNCCDDTNVHPLFGVLKSNIKVMVTTQKIPNPFTYYYRKDIPSELFTFVGLVDGISSIDIVPYNLVKHRLRLKYVSNLPFGTFDGSKFIFFNLTPGTSIISVRGIFPYPEEVGNIFNCEGEFCYKVETDPYPITDEYITIIKKYILDTEAKFILQKLTDNLNDSRDGLQT